MLIGYTRVSPQEQNLDKQIDQLKEADCEKIICEKVTGTKKACSRL
ncbi:recombinase family protein [Brassicibacter mesophilus]